MQYSDKNAVQSNTGYRNTEHRNAGYSNQGYPEEIISLSALSLKGTRSRQEDYLLYGQGGGRTIAVVCDGIGGMDNGDAASRAAAELLFTDLERTLPEEDMYPFFRAEMERLDDAVFGLRYRDGGRMKAGTTVVAALLYGHRLHWFSVGDSRLYLSRGRQLQCLTKAHNYATMLEEKKKTGPVEESWYREEAKKGEWLTSYLGMGIAEEFDYGSLYFSGEAREKLLLCTDGLYKTVDHEELARILQAGKTMEAISCGLREAVLRENRPAQDNATWIVMGREE